MNFKPRKFFVIVGNPHTGKGKTTQQIFGRRLFFPFKQPITSAFLGKEPFVIIFPRYPGFDNYLMRIKTIIQFHRESETSFFIIMNLLPGKGICDEPNILEYFNQSGFELHYLLLSSSWYDKRMLSASDIELFEKEVKNGTVYLLDRMVTKSPLRFSERTDEIKEVILKALEREQVHF